MLFVCAGAALAMGASIPANFSSGIEALVGVMLVGLGSHVLWQLARNRVHFHSHSHGDGSAHFHAHSHKAEPVVRGKQHRLVYHGHEHGVRWRTLAVGLMHGLAGSGALLVLTVSQMKSVGTGLATIALFGLGSMVGMAAVSGLIAIPLAGTARRLTFANHALQLVIGVATIAMGAATVYARVAA
jgi:cytochrome c biogenesis protein CcdA